MSSSASSTLAAVRNCYESDEPDAIREAKRLYAEEMIDEPELEQCIEEAVDNDQEAVRIVGERVKGTRTRARTQSPVSSKLWMSFAAPTERDSK